MTTNKLTDTRTEYTVEAMSDRIARLEAQLATARADCERARQEKIAASQAGYDLARRERDEAYQIVAEYQSTISRMSAAHAGRLAELQAVCLKQAKELTELREAGGQLYNHLAAIRDVEVPYDTRLKNLDVALEFMGRVWIK